MNYKSLENYRIYTNRIVQLSDSDNNAITIVETVIFMIMNTIMIIGLCILITTMMSNIVSGHDSRLLFHQLYQSTSKSTIEMVRQSATILFMNTPKVSQ